MILTNALALLENSIRDDGAVASGGRIGGACEAVRGACRGWRQIPFSLSSDGSGKTCIELHKCSSASPTTFQP